MTNTIVYKPLDKLVFDPENPRLPESLRKKKDELDYEDLVVNWMLTNENVVELMGSIGEKGYFSAEPLLVVPKLNHTDLFEVVEGNRRLTAVKLLKNPELAKTRIQTIKEIGEEAKKKPDELPVIEFSSRNDVLAYLGYKHITGVQSWDSLAKAKYLNQLISILPPAPFPEQCKTLAKMIGSNSSYVRSLLVGEKIYREIENRNFFNISNLREEKFEFGVFYTAFNRSNISKYVGVTLNADDPLKDLNVDHLEDLTRWMFEKNSENNTRIGESRNLSKLNKVLDYAYPKALVDFKDGGKSLDEAVRLTDHPLNVFQSHLNDSLKAIETARNFSHEVEKPNLTHIDTLKSIFSIARELYQISHKKHMDETDSLL